MIYASTPVTGSALHKGPGKYLAAGVGWGRVHEPNPILLAFRERGDAAYAEQWYHAVIALMMFGGYREWNDERSYFHPLTLATEPQRRHAALVLGRLTRLAKEPA